jgi:hypothetical protein
MMLHFYQSSAGARSIENPSGRRGFLLVTKMPKCHHSYRYFETIFLDPLSPNTLKYVRLFLGLFQRANDWFLSAQSIPIRDEVFSADHRLGFSWSLLWQ